MAVVNAVAVAVNHHSAALGRALRLVEPQHGDLGEFGAGAAATAAVGAAPAQDFLPLILKRNKRAMQCNGTMNISFKVASKRPVNILRKPKICNQQHHPPSRRMLRFLKVQRPPSHLVRL